MQVFGGLTRSTAIALFVVQALASAATAVAIAKLGETLGLKRAGRIAALVWALYPIAVWNAVHTVWDTTFTALGLTLVLLSVASLPRAPSPGRVVAAGAALGALLLINPAPLSVAPVLALYVATRAASLSRRVLDFSAFALAA